MAELPVLEAASRMGSGKGAARTARREGNVPGVIYGGGLEPQSINIRSNVLLKTLKAGKFLSTLLNLKVDGQDNKVICRSVQRDVVKDMPIHADFLRLSEKSRITIFIPVIFENEEESPGLKKGGVLTVVRPEVELLCTAASIPDHLTVDLTGLDIGDAVKIHDIVLPAGTKPVITGRDFVIANISAPSVLKAEDEEEEEGEELEEGEEGEEQDGDAEE